MRKSLIGSFRLPVNLQFFKGGSTETVRKRDPKSAQHLAMDEAIFNLLSPIAMRYGGSDIFGGTLPKASTAVQPKQAEAGNNGSGGYWRTYGEESSAGPKLEWVSAGSNQPSQTVSNGKLGSVQPGSVQPSRNATDPLTAFNDSILGRNLDYADLQHEMVNRNTVDLLDKVPGYLDQSNNALRKSEYLADTYQNPYGKSDFDEYVRKMGETADRSTEYATKYYDDADWYINQNKALAESGGSQALDNLMSKVYESLNSGYKSMAGELLNDAARRGVINSSTNTRAMRGLSDSVAQAGAQQYMTGFGTLLDNSLKGAQTADNLAQNVVRTADQSNANYQNIINSMLGINDNSLKTMQGRAGVLQNAASGYNQNYNSGLQGLETFAKLPTQYYQNALAPISPLYNYWKDLTDSYYGHEDYDTVVHNGK
jgi:hypothetical protein